MTTSYKQKLAALTKEVEELREFKRNAEEIERRHYQAQIYSLNCKIEELQRELKTPASGGVVINPETGAREPKLG